MKDELKGVIKGIASKKVLGILLLLVLTFILLPLDSVVPCSTPGLTGFVYDSRLEDKNANQGVCSDGIYLYATNNWNIFKYDKEGNLRAYTSMACHEGTDMAQINGIYYNSSDDRLYVGSNNAPSPGKTSYIKVFEASNLSFVEEYQVKDYWTEGCSFYDGSWWVIYHDWGFISRYSTSWMWQADYELGYEKSAGYDGIIWIDDYLFVNIHEWHNPSKCDVYKWDGSGFTETARLDRPTDNCTQGMGGEPGENIIWWAERTAGEQDNIVKSYIIEALY